MEDDLEIMEDDLKRKEDNHMAQVDLRWSNIIQHDWSW
jgi:hypothetical protein